MYTGGMESEPVERTTREVREHLADVINAAVRGHVTYITSRGRRIAAVVPLASAGRAATCKERDRLAGESRVTSMDLRDLPAYREMTDTEAFKKAKAAKATSAPRIRIRQEWVADCDACGMAIKPEQGSFESQQDAGEAKQRHLDEHARGEWA